MSENKRVLIVIGGITENLYFRRDLESDISLLCELYKKYEYIVEINTNKHRDSWSPRFIDKSPWTDVYKLYLNPFRRRAIHREIEKTVERFQNNGYEIDVFAHSLGTVELTGTNIQVNNVCFFGSPLGMDFPCGAFCRNKLAPFPFSRPKFRCENFYNFYSPRDIVGTSPILSDYRCNFGVLSNQEFNTNTVHDLTEYLSNEKVRNIIINLKKED
jgi:hypothetical protein